MVRVVLRCAVLRCAVVDQIGGEVDCVCHNEWRRLPRLSGSSSMADFSTVASFVSVAGKEFESRHKSRMAGSSRSYGMI